MPLFRISALNKKDVQFDGEIVLMMTPSDAISHWIMSSDYVGSVDVSGYYNYPDSYIFKYQAGSLLSDTRYLFARKSANAPYYDDYVYHTDINTLIDQLATKGYINFIEQRLFKKIEEDGLIAGFNFYSNLNLI